MRLYRFRIVKASNELVALQEYECSNDSAAYTKARTLCAGQNVEVWEGSRWVATVNASPSPPGPPAHVFQ